MVNKEIDAVADIAVAAGEMFTSAYRNAEISVGVISSTLRSMGINADAVNIDCAHSGKRLALIIMDQNPNMVGIGIGQKETVGNYELIMQVPATELDRKTIFGILEQRFYS